MTREEFVKRVFEAVQQGSEDEVNHIWHELMSEWAYTYPEVTTSGSGVAKVQWGTQ